jgi:RNA polymerase sigma-70 factor (ECF subfamily)
VLRIVSNRAKTRAVRERRTVPFSALSGDLQADEPAVDPDRFLPAGHRWAGHWASPPASWRELPEDLLLSREIMTEVERAVATLPAAQRAVLVLRDVEGLTAAEACQLLDLTEGNQRVLLHRGRSKVRAALERHLDAPHRNGPGSRDPCRRSPGPPPILARPRAVPCRSRRCHR